MAVLNFTKFIYFQLPTGEEIISKVKEWTENDEGVVLSVPAMVVAQEGKFALAPFAPFAEDGEILVDKSLIKIKGNPHPQILDDYKNSFHPNEIVVPSNKLFIPK